MARSLELLHLSTVRIISNDFFGRLEQGNVEVQKHRESTTFSPPPPT